MNTNEKSDKIVVKYKELVEEYKFKYGRKPTMLEMFLEGMKFVENAG